MNETAIKFLGVLAFLILGGICSTVKVPEIQAMIGRNAKQVLAQFPEDSFYLTLNGRRAEVKGIVKDSLHIRQVTAQLQATPGLIIEKIDLRYLPPAPRVVQEDLDSLLYGKRVEFLPNKSKLDSGSYPLLDRVAALLKKYPNVGIEIAGHTDDRGDTAYNLRLSQQRAEQVREYLARAGISPERLNAVGYGESRPLVNERSREARRKNRRVEFKILEHTK